MTLNYNNDNDNNNKYIGSSLQDTINEFVENDIEAKELMEKQELINAISNSIIAMRQTYGITQNELAEKANTKQTAISRSERGNLNSIPTIGLLNRIAKVFNKKLIIRFE